MSNIKKILSQEISTFLQKIYIPYIDQINMEYEQYENTNPAGSLEKFFLIKIEEQINLHSSFTKILKEQEITYNNTTNEEEKKKIILSFAKLLGANEEELIKDEKAFKRWFDFDVVVERCHEKMALIERKLHFLIEKIHFIEAINPSTLNFLLQIAITYKGNESINLTALESIAVLLKRGFSPKDNMLENILKFLEFKHSDLKTTAKYMEILSYLNPEKFIYYLKEFLSADLTAEMNIDLIFFKENIINSMLNLEKIKEEDIEFLSLKILSDSSGLAKQAYCNFLLKVNSSFSLSQLEKIILSEEENAVKGYAIIKLSEKIIKEKDLEYLVLLSNKVIEKERSEFILRLLLTQINIICLSLDDVEIVNKYADKLKNFISQILANNFSISIQYWAMEVNLLFWLFSKKEFLTIKNKLQELINLPALEDIIEISDNEINSLSLEDMGKLIYLIAKDDFDLEFYQDEGTYIIKRGASMKFRLWRFLHEISISIPDKRQNHSHTVGRVYLGENLALSSIAEVAPTQVPGELLYINEEHNIRGFLPLLDYCLSILRKGKEVQLYSSEGITTISPPRNLISRLIARFLISVNFKKIAKLRNWQEGVFWHQNTYINKLREYGLQISFNEYKNEPCINHTKAFFNSLAFFPLFWDFNNLRDYFLAPHANNLLSLIIFILILIGGLGISKLISYNKHIKKRNKIPLVIGGWGTRGKTGVERLKAALFNTMGLKVIGKTTGCKATIVLGEIYKPLHEFPISRPFGQTSIWEQREVVNYADALKAEVFLWECMALKPPYVNIMQTEWMRDDISTITNAHPDHEETQGPAGIDIANSIASFIPEKAVIFTSEEQMLPIFKEQAKIKETLLIHSNWVNSGLITKDILTLFPYYEHPSNIALVIKMAEELGVKRSFALKGMIKNVVPDIGALKAFVPCPLYGRQLQFINGMSANEEVGTINNWHRLEFNKIAINSDIFISTIVNNRTDRIRRSRVFAEIIANKLDADRHFLIGTNVHGMKNYILKEWNKYVENFISALKESKQLELLEKIFIKLRICVNEAEKKQRQNYITSSTEPIISDATEKFKLEFEHDYEQYLKLRKLIQEGNIPEEEIKEVLNALFLKKLIVIEEESTPDDIITKIIEHTPPGFTHKLMGIQNIKSPGIDLIRAWQQWEKCNKALKDLKIQNDKKIKKALYTLAEYSYYTLLVRERIRDEINALNPIYQDTYYIELGKIHQILSISNSKKDTVLKSSNFFSVIFKEIIEIIRKMKVKKIYEQLFQDLINKRISINRAHIILKRYEHDI